MEELQAHAPRLMDTPPRRKFGSRISSNTPPRSPTREATKGKNFSSTRVKGPVLDIKFDSLQLQSHHNQSNTPRHTSNVDRNTESAPIHYIDTLLPGSFHVSSSLPSPTNSTAGDGQVGDNNDPTRTLFAPVDLSTPHPSSPSETLRDFVLSPSMIRKQASCSDAKQPAAASPSSTNKPRYTVLLQVLKSIANGQSYVSQAIGTKVTEKLSAALDAPAHHKELSTTLAHKTQVMQELCAAASDPTIVQLQQISDRHIDPADQQTSSPLLAPPTLMEEQKPCSPVENTVSNLHAAVSCQSLIATEGVPPVRTCQGSSLDTVLPAMTRGRSQELEYTGLAYATVTIDSMTVGKNDLQDRLHESEKALAQALSGKAQLESMIVLSDDKLAGSHHEMRHTMTDMTHRLEQTEAENKAETAKNTSATAIAETYIADQSRQSEALEQRLQDKQEDGANGDCQIDLRRAQSISYEAQLVEAVNEVSQLQSQLQSHMAAERNRSRETDSLRKQNDKLNSQVSRLQNALSDKEDQMSAKSTEFMLCKSSLDDSKTELFQKREELHFALRSNDKLKSKVSSLNAKLISVTKRGQEEKNLLSKEASEKCQESTELRRQLANRDSIIRSMRNNLAEIEKKKEESLCQLASERETNKKAKHSARELLVSTQKRLSDTRTKLLCAEEAESKQKTECRKLEEQVHLLEQRIKNNSCAKAGLILKLDATEAILQKERKSFAENLAAEQQRCTQLSEQVATTNLAVSRLQSELDFLKCCSEDKDTRLRTELASVIEKHSSALAAKDAVIEGLKQTCSSLRDDSTAITRLQNSLANANYEISQQKVSSKEMADEHTKYIAVLTGTHAREVERLQSESHRLELAYKKCEEKLGATEERLCSTNKQLQTLRSDRERFIAENGVLRSELHHVKDLVEELNGELAALARDESSSDDSSDGEYSDLRRADLKSLCSTHLIETKRAKLELRDKASECERLESRLSKTDGDMKLLAVELKELVRINTQLNSSASECRQTLVAAERRESLLRANVLNLEENLKIMEDELQQRSDLVLSLKEEKAIQQTKLDEHTCTRDHVDDDMELHLQQLTAEKLDLTDQVDSANAEVRSKTELLHEATEENERVKTLLAVAESNLALATTHLEESNSLLHQNKTNDDASLQTLKAETSSLRSQIDALNLELDTAHHEIDAQEAREHELEEKLAFQLNDLLRRESCLELSESKLNHASQVMESQSKSIKALELRALEAERLSDSLSARVTSLQAVVDELESSLVTSGATHALQINELEEKLSQKENEHSRAKNEYDSQRDDIRDLRRKYTEQEKQNKMLETRLESIRQALLKTKSDLLEERVSLEEAQSSIADLKAKSDDDKSEIHHLSARVHLLDAMVARLKSENSLLDEARRLAEDDKGQIMNNLELEKDTMTNKLVSLSELYQTQQEAIDKCIRSKNKLLRLIDEAVDDGDVAFLKLVKLQAPSSDAAAAAAAAAGSDIRALDLAQPFNSSLALSSANNYHVNMAIAAWDTLKSRLDEWKEDRSIDRPCNPLSTPPPKMRPNASILGTPAIKDALENVKRLFQEELLSPNKIGRSEPSQEDAKHFQEVIRDLEIRIDELLFDLKEVNGALRSKSQLFHDLEELLKEYEQERDKLQLQVEQRAAMVRELEGSLEHETAMRHGLEMQLAEIQQQAEEKQDTAGTALIPTNEDNKVTAGRIIAECLQNRSRRAQASCFTKWACHVAVVKALEQQSELEHRLADELRMTREKFSLLKKHLKRKGRGGLEMITEDSEGNDEETM